MEVASRARPHGVGCGSISLQIPILTFISGALLQLPSPRSPPFSSLLALSPITGLPTSCRVSLLLPWVLPHVGDRDPAPVPHVEQLLVADVRLVATWLALMG